MRHDIAAAAAILLAFSEAGAATATSGEAGSPAIVASRIEVVQDSDSGQKKVRAPMVYLDGFAVGRSYMLRSTLSPGDPPHIQLYVTAQFEDWAYLDAARTRDREPQQRLDVTPIDRNHFGCRDRERRKRCTLTETVGINISLQDLRSYAASGLRFRVDGRSGSTEMEVPAAYFGAFAQRLFAEMTAPQQ